MYYTIGEMARLMHVQTSALRYYDKEGLLPFVERSESGIRLFRDSDFIWLATIECLKKTGMPLTEIKRYITLGMQGDATIDERLELIRQRQQAVQRQMQELLGVMEVLNYKEWYYLKAQECGTTDVPRNMPLEEVPEEVRGGICRLRRLPEAENE